MDNDNPILKTVDELLDRLEKIVGEKVKEPVRGMALGLVGALRTFLQVPDNYAGDLD